MTEQMMQRLQRILQELSEIKKEGISLQEILEGIQQNISSGEDSYMQSHEMRDYINTESQGQSDIVYGMPNRSNTVTGREPTLLRTQQSPMEEFVGRKVSDIIEFGSPSSVKKEPKSIIGQILSDSKYAANDVYQSLPSGVKNAARGIGDAVVNAVKDTSLVDFSNRLIQPIPSKPKVRKKITDDVVNPSDAVMPEQVVIYDTEEEQEDDVQVFRDRLAKARSEFASQPQGKKNYKMVLSALTDLNNALARNR